MEPSVNLWFTQPWIPLPVPSAYLERIGLDGVVLAEEDGLDDDWPIEGNLQTRTVTIGEKKYAAVFSDVPVGAGAIAEDECVDGLQAPPKIMHKDNNDEMDTFYHPNVTDHYRAAGLAIRQTSQEWCRLLSL